MASISDGYAKDGNVIEPFQGKVKHLSNLVPGPGLSALRQLLLIKNKLGRFDHVFVRYLLLLNALDYFSPK